jgi:hypothetical protein
MGGAASSRIGSTMPIELDDILPAEKILDAAHRVAEQTLIRRQENCLLLGQNQLDILPLHALSWMFPNTVARVAL